MLGDIFFHWLRLKIIISVCQIKHNQGESVFYYTLTIIIPPAPGPASFNDFLSNPACSAETGQILQQELIGPAAPEEGIPVALCGVI